MLELAIFFVLPLLALTVLLLTASRDQATATRLIAHLSTALASAWLLVAALPDGGLFIGIAGVLLLVSASTAALLASALTRDD